MWGLLDAYESSTENCKGMSAKIIFIMQLIFVFGASILAGPLQLIGFFTFIPLLAANKLFQSANSLNDNEQVIEFKRSHHLLGIVGCIFVTYIMTTFL